MNIGEVHAKYPKENLKNISGKPGKIKVVFDTIDTVLLAISSNHNNRLRPNILNYLTMEY